VLDHRRRSSRTPSRCRERPKLLACSAGCEPVRDITFREIGQREYFQRRYLARKADGCLLRVFAARLVVVWNNSHTLMLLKKTVEYSPRATFQRRQDCRVAVSPMGRRLFTFFSPSTI